MLVAADRAAAARCAGGDRRRALAIVGGATLGRVWLVTLAILLVGLLGEREDGLAAAVLSLRPGHGPPRLPGALEAALPRADAVTPMSTKAKVFLGLGLYLLITVILVVVVGSAGKNDEFQPQNEFRLDPWIELTIGGVDLSITKAVLYLVLASGLTIGTMVFIARRMQREPNKVQMAVELAYDLTRNNITGGNIPDEKLARKWFPYLAGLFFFIWFSNMLGYMPLPTNTEHKVDIFGLEVPSLAIYAATANISIPLVLALISVVAYHFEGVRAKGLFGYLKSWLPPGLEDMNVVRARARSS